MSPIPELDKVALQGYPLTQCQLPDTAISDLNEQLLLNAMRPSPHSAISSGKSTALGDGGHVCVGGVKSKDFATLNFLPRFQTGFRETEKTGLDGVF